MLRAISDEAPKTPVAKRHILLKEHAPNTSITYPVSEYNAVGEPNGKSKEVRFAIDEKGFIVPSNVFKDPHVKIVFLGGSTTECSAVAEKKRFPYLVGQLMSRDDFKVNTINAGVAGNNSIHTLNVYLNKVLIEEPDIAVMMHNINDLNLFLKGDDYWRTNRVASNLITEGRSLNKALSNKFRSILPNIHSRLRNVSENFKPDPVSPPRGPVKYVERDTSPVFQQFKENLLLFISISRIKGVTPVLMTQASRIKDDFKGVEVGIGIIEGRYKMPFQQYKELYAAMNQVIRDVCEEQNVLMIDLDAKVTPEYMSDAVHFVERGSEYVADLIVQQLTPLARGIVLEVQGQ